jgi:hypothetical protein
MFITLTEINEFLSVLQHFQQAFACCFLQILARTRGGVAHFGPQNTPRKPPISLGIKPPSFYLLLSIVSSPRESLGLAFFSIKVKNLFCKLV